MGDGLVDLRIILTLAALGVVFGVLRIVAWLSGARSLTDVIWHGLLRRPRGPAQRVERTALARTGMANLPLDLSMVAGAGRSATAPDTLGDHTLRPTIGLRLISLGISALVLYLIWFGPAETRLPYPPASWTLTAAVAYGILYIQTYEARYDRDRINYRDALMRQHEVLWRDVFAIRDDGHYEYHLLTDSGRKIRLQKYLVGISDFLTYAETRIAQNRRD